MGGVHAPETACHSSRYRQLPVAGPAAAAVCPRCGFTPHARPSTCRPPGEKWALLVNEFGSLGIDAALLEAELEAQQVQEQQGQEQPSAGSSSTSTSASTGSSSSSSSGYVVRELAGGCLCCTLSGPLGVAIAQLVRNAKPDRLIIEPSGLGHPAGGQWGRRGREGRGRVQLCNSGCGVPVCVRNGRAFGQKGSRQ